MENENNEIQETELQILSFKDIEKIYSGFEEGKMTTKILGVVKKIFNEPDNMENKEKIERYIDKKIHDTMEIIEDYQSMEVHPLVEEVHEYTIRVFYGYYEGLIRIKNYLTTGDNEQLMIAFNFFAQSDGMLAETQGELGKCLEDNPMDFVL